MSDPSPIEDISGWKWPGRLTELCDSWKRATTDRERNRLVSEMWLLLNVGLTYYVRAHGETYGRIDPEDARDIASEKAMVFLRRLDSEPPDDPPSPARICAYVSTLARNGLVDILRKQGRAHNLEQKLVDLVTPPRPRSSNSSEANIQRSEFVDAICGCMSKMPPRARSVWFLRVFLDLPSKKIAAHPDVRMTAPGVDMLLTRTRRALRECMDAKGFNAGDAPTGTFLALWDLLRGDTKGEARSEND